jgi:ABC-type lipopolysaccharide export system ATPase subunit
MKKRPLKRSLEYKARVRAYTLGLAERYRAEVAEVFLASVKQAEDLLLDNNYAGTDAPYTLAGQQVVLKELHFSSGPVQYCLIYEVTDHYVELISLWHGAGSRKTETMERLWRYRKLSQ